jgi:hypothetical protein
MISKLFVFEHNIRFVFNGWPLNRSADVPLRSSVAHTPLALNASLRKNVGIVDKLFNCTVCALFVA